MLRDASKERVVLEQSLIRLYLQALLEARTQRSSAIVFEPVDGALQLTFSSTTDDAPTSKVVSAPQELAKPLLNFLLDRCCYWPDPGDALFETNTAKTKRVIAAPLSQARMFADFTANRRQAGTAVVLSNLIYDNIPAIPDMLSLSDKQREPFDHMIRAKTGLIVASVTDKPHHIDGVAALAAARPDACVIRSCNTADLFSQALELAQSTFVVIGNRLDDPVEMAMQLLSLAVDTETRSQAVDVLRGAFVHTRVRRVCGGCARSTPLAAQTLERLPMQLRSSTKNTYLFGRGCEACGHAAYRGMTGLNSVFVINDSVRDLLRAGSAVGEITRFAYAMGVRSLLEDGLEKIFSGATSFEEVFNVTTKISAAFAGAIATATSVTGTGSHRVDGTIEGMDPETFFSADGERRAGPPPKPSAQPRVLIVEDDADQRAVLEAIFSSAGYAVFGADNGQSALTTLQEQSVDVIVCDVMMPVLNGAQFVRELRSQPGLKAIPVLMLTAVDNPEVEVSLLNHGADDYCEKNVKKRVLLTRVEKLLQRKPRAKNPLEHMLKD